MAKDWIRPQDFYERSDKIIRDIEYWEERIEQAEERFVRAFELACACPVPARLRQAEKADLKRGRVVWEIPIDRTSKQPPYWMTVGDCNNDAGTFVDREVCEEHTLNDRMFVEDKANG